MDIFARPVYTSPAENSFAEKRNEPKTQYANSFLEGPRARGSLDAFQIRIAPAIEGICGVSLLYASIANPLDDEGEMYWSVRIASSGSIPWAKEERSIIIEFGSSRDNAEAGVITGYVPMDGSYQLALSTPADFAPRRL